MGNLEAILSLIATILILLSTVIGLIIKLYKAIKDKNAEEVKNVFLEAAKEAVAYAEAFSDKSGSEKKEIALSEIKNRLKTNYDAQKASEAIESIIKLSKQINGKSMEDK